MPGTESIFNWCLRRGEKGEKHSGIRRIPQDEEESERHVNKALHNLKAFDHNSTLFPDWAVSAAFYAMYHALLAVLFRLGHESRNQECTINNPGLKARVCWCCNKCPQAFVHTKTAVFVVPSIRMSA